MLYVALFFVALIVLGLFTKAAINGFIALMSFACQALYIAVVMPIALLIDVVCTIRAWYVRRSRRFALASPAFVDVVPYDDEGR